MKVWLEELETYPQAGIEWAFREHQRTSKYFPQVSEILALIKNWKDQVNAQGKSAGCERCGGTGWLRVVMGETIGGNPVNEHHGALIRCECVANATVPAYKNHVKRLREETAQRRRAGERIYDENDVAVLMKLIIMKRTAVDRDLTDDEKLECLANLDRLKNQAA